MKKLVVLVVSLGVLSSMAFSWGSATHIYMYEQLKKLGAIPNTNAIYGVIAPDVFNYMFTPPELAGYLYDQTHHNFMAFWGAQKNQKDKSLGFGFVAHNDTWGIDSTAHQQALSLPYPTSDGYVIDRSYILYAYIGGTLTNPPPAGYGLSETVALEVCHNLIESAIDLMIKRLEPNLPAKLISAATHADKNFLDLMYQAYGPGLALGFGLDEAAVKTIIAQNDMVFRYSITSLGTALKKKAPQDIAAVAEQLAAAAQAAFGLTVDPADVVPLLELAMNICKDSFLAEINATIQYVAQELQSHNIIK
jgi:hypothetical protein